MKLFLILLVVYKFSIPIESFNLQDIGKSATDVAKGVIEKIPDAIPSPEDLFQAGKNLIAGYPFEQVCILYSFSLCFPNISHSCLIVMSLACISENCTSNNKKTNFSVYFMCNRFFRLSTNFVSEIDSSKYTIGAMLGNFQLFVSMFEHRFGCSINKSRAAPVKSRHIENEIYFKDQRSKYYGAIE